MWFSSGLCGCIRLPVGLGFVDWFHWDLVQSREMLSGDAIDWKSGINVNQPGASRKQSAAGMPDSRHVFVMCHVSLMSGICRWKETLTQKSLLRTLYLSLRV